MGCGDGAWRTGLRRLGCELGAGPRQAGAGLKDRGCPGGLPPQVGGYLKIDTRGRLVCGLPGGTG